MGIEAKRVDSSIDSLSFSFVHEGWKETDLVLFLKTAISILPVFVIHSCPMPVDMPSIGKPKLGFIVRNCEFQDTFLIKAEHGFDFLMVGCIGHIEYFIQYICGNWLGPRIDVLFKKIPQGLVQLVFPNQFT